MNERENSKGFGLLLKVCDQVRQKGRTVGQEWAAYRQSVNNLAERLCYGQV